MEKKKNNNVWLIVFVVIIILIFKYTCSSTPTPNIQTQEPSYKVEADQLEREYKDNEVAADAKYKGKVIIVNGWIQSIGKDIKDDAYIIISFGGRDYGVQCMFPKDQQSSVAQLHKGDGVFVKGVVAGKGLGSVLVRESAVVYLKPKQSN